MTKAEKVQMINEAISRSTLAIRKQAKAEIIGGRIQYTMIAPNGRYTMRAKLIEIISLLDGKDMRMIYSRLGIKIAGRKIVEF